MKSISLSLLVVTGMLVVAGCGDADKKSDRDGDTDTDADSETATNIDSETGMVCSGTKTWYDDIIGLCWQKTPSAKTKTYSSAENYCEDLEIGGQGDWRLPNIDEMIGLIRGCQDVSSDTDSCIEPGVCMEGIATGDQSLSLCNMRPVGCAALDTCISFSTSSCGPCPILSLNPGNVDCYWDPALSGTCGSYWSSSVHANNENYEPISAWTLSFDSGGLFSAIKSGSPYNKLLVRCVRGEGSRDADSDSDTDTEWGVLDEATGIYWQHPISTSKYTWQDAIDYCNDLTLGGYSDWELPSSEALFGVLAGCNSNVMRGDGGWCESCEYSSTCNNLFGADVYAYWSSSSSVSYSDSAWIVNFYSGKVDQLETAETFSVRCVRGGQ